MVFKEPQPVHADPLCGERASSNERAKTMATAGNAKQKTHITRNHLGGVTLGVTPTKWERVGL
jgi:hypothetical protein